ncbi:hypothetical protein M0534_01395 [Methylonatrum kenyense]|uniref:WapI family immunity protein n=1 Tax=Methylonatrum kenyense TaxID=455253 RepID=UPI0020BED8B2|nr:hypothetical protein [Methylonatrum kenyense]MCK8514986.1 hypothetical protein [Methylonatrum kenyense]
MQLENPEGERLDLTISGYQFPDLRTDYWDANWLLVSIDVAHPRGEWRIHEPCMTAFELKELADWFERVADGDSVEDRCDFVEPNLAFEYRSTPNAELQITLACEASPPWLADRDQRLDGITMSFPVTAKDMRDHARCLRALSDTFPLRVQRDGTPVENRQPAT